jgi:N-glycosylase/DNA lyase
MNRKSPAIKELIASYRKIKPEIDKRLSEFRSITNDVRCTKYEVRLFSELCFCLLTANANALRCNDAICELNNKGLLFTAPSGRLKSFLKGRVRFHNKKADFIVGSRKHYDTIKDRLKTITNLPSCHCEEGQKPDEAIPKERLRLPPSVVHWRDRNDGHLHYSKRTTISVINMREWLVSNIKGYGYKEASHFLRNIGLGRDIAILDRHILKNLKKFSVINKIPDSVGPRKIYLEIEEKMRRFSRDIGIPLDALDLLFWSLQTGFIFK